MSDVDMMWLTQCNFAHVIESSLMEEKKKKILAKVDNFRSSFLNGLHPPLIHI